MHQSFLKKYSPQYLENFLLKKDIIYFLHTLIESNNINIIINGDCGTGKTTLIQKLVDLYYNKNVDSVNNILTINCLREQGIQFYRNDVKIFCQTKSSILNKKKIIILDDFDNINEQSQQIFRNYLDKYSNNVMFLCSCSNINKINDNFLSRIFLIKFEKITYDYLLKILLHIKDAEKLNIETSVNNILIKLSNNSFRNLINNLEKIKLFNNSITKENIYKVCSNINFELYSKYTTAILEKDIGQSIKDIYKIYEEGYSVIDIFYFYFIYIKQCSTVCEDKKYSILKILCKYIAFINNNYEDDSELILFSKDLISII